MSFNRADAAKKAIKAAIDKAKADFSFSLIMRDIDKVKANLENAAQSDPPLLPMDEMHGADQTNPDIKESKLFSHLSKELKAPDEGEQDILEKENVKGKALPESLQNLAEKDIASFRTGVDGKRKLTEQQRLERLYPWLRRALVTLEPPVPDRKPISVDDILRNFLGNPIACTDKHKSTFLNEPMPENEKMFINNCKGK